MPDRIAYCSYAKINLYLDVLNRRRDGYHNIETIFQTVSLADQLIFTEAGPGIALECSAQELDEGATNLAYRAGKLLQERTGCSRGVHIHLDKKIPVAAGLAGGSGNAAAALVALNQLWDLGLPDAQLRELALELGSDVPYCMVGGTIAATVRGEELTPLPPLSETWFVLVHPPIAVSTTRVFNSPKLILRGNPPAGGPTPAFRGAIEALECRDFARAVFNILEGPVFADYPRLAAAEERLLAEGCLAAGMSGSGPTLFGICLSKEDAERVAVTFDDFQTSVVTTVPAGIERTD